jgi:predicted outer membrane repeat protein
MSRTSTRMQAGVFAAASFIAIDAQAGFEVFVVGGDAACPYTTIQDAVDAAAAHPGTDYVWIAMDATYTGQHVTITDQDVIVEGGFVDCNDIDVDTALTTVSGAGNDGSAVFSIRGNSNVYLGNMLITGAARGAGTSGGGVDFDGSGSLTLLQASITANGADYGAGMNIHGDGGHIEVALSHDTLIIGNTAGTSGGGIRIEGDTRMRVLDPKTLIGYNHAPNGYGGGIEVLGPAQADIGSPGYNTGAVIQFNDAQYGGGIAIVSPDEGQNAVARLFTVDPANPVQVADNSASATGGGIFLKPKTTPTLGHGDATLCASEFRIDDNVAQEGAAIYADEDSFADQYWGSTVLINRGVFAGDVCSTPEPIAALGALSCAGGIPCNEFDSNIAEDVDANPTDGSTILVQSNGFFAAARLRATRNAGAHVLRGLGDSGSLNALTDCLIAHNQVTAELFAITDGTDGLLSFNACTIADNEIGAPYVMLAGDFTDLTDSIISQPDRMTIDARGDAPDVSYVLSNDIGTLGSGPGIVQGFAAFVDAADGDYHLLDVSTGVDFAPTLDGVDLDGNPRTVNLDCIVDYLGALDLGAFETQACSPRLDEIFGGDFEVIIGLKLPIPR